MPRQTDSLPKINQPMMGGFRWFNRKYLAKHFHSVATNREKLFASSTDTPSRTAGSSSDDARRPLKFSSQDSLVVYANHASWWDPLAAMFIADELFGDFRMYAPIDAEAFEKYKMFGQMGFFPIDRSSLRGAAHFLRTSKSILEQAGSAIFITPEGRFVDVRDPSAELMPGMSHLAAKIATGNTATQNTTAPKIWFVSGAVEFTFWEERKPELLVWFGEPVCASPEAAAREMDNPGDKQAWHLRLTETLRTAQQELASAAIARDSSQFEILLGSKSGTFFVYDWYRKVKSKISGTAIDVDHGEKLQARDKR